jgi:hypothetical protein
MSFEMNTGDLKVEVDTVKETVTIRNDAGPWHGRVIFDEVRLADLAAVLTQAAERVDAGPCEYTHSHTRYWCGNPNCRES